MSQAFLIYCVYVCMSVCVYVSVSVGHKVSMLTK